MRPIQTEPVTNWSSSVRFLWKLLSAWRWSTFILGAACTAWSDYGYWLQYKLNLAELIIATIGTLAALAFLKSAWLLMAYPLVCRARFKGSLLRMTALISVLLVLNLVAVASVATLQGAQVPRAQLPWMITGAYIFFTLALWLAFTFSHRIFSRRLA